MRIWTYIHLAAIMPLCAVPVNATYEIHALVQDRQCVIVDTNDEFTIYRLVPGHESGFQWPFLLMIGKDLDKTQQSLLYVETVNTGRSTNSYLFHEEGALKRMHYLFNEQAEFRNRVIWCMPVFLRPADDRLLYTHALDRDSMLTDRPQYKRLDLQVINMVQTARQHLEAEHGVKTRHKFAIGGFSAAGEFAQRFSMLHPQKLAFVVAGGIGGLPVLPLKEIESQKLRYPIGIDDFEDLTGRSFDTDSLSALPRFLYYGSEDTNDPVKYSDAYDPEDKDVVFAILGENPAERFEECVRIYDELGWATQAHIDVGASHYTSKDMAQKILTFYRDNLNKSMKTISDTLIEMERDALERWGNGDPGGFLDIAAEDVVYFDPYIGMRIEGRDALRELYESIWGKVKVDRFELLNPKVQKVGDTAVLTYNYISYSGEKSTAWNCTEVYFRRGTKWEIIQTHWSYTRHPAICGQSVEGEG